MDILIRRGDIADQPDLDAVTNAANTELWMGSGVAGALRARGGEAIEREAVRQGPIRLGDAVITGAGGLPNRWVIHAAAMGYRPEDDAVPKKPGTRSSAAIIASCVRRVLELADGAGARGVGLVALATGVGGFPLDECATVMIDAVRAYARAAAASRIERVVFVVRGEHDRRVFEAALARD